MSTPADTAGPVDWQERLTRARTSLALRHPYFAEALATLDVVPSPGLGTFAVDASWRLYVDPAALALWSPAETIGVLLHELMHLLHDHAGRAADAGVPESAGSAEPTAWNLAADAEINDDLLSGGVLLPPGAVTPRMLGMHDHATAEQYFTHVRARASSPSGQERDCGSGSDGIPRTYEEESPDGDSGDGTGGLGPLRREALRRRTAEAVRDAGPGTVTAGLRRWADDVLQPRIDWRRVLATSVRASIPTRGRGDYTWSRPSRRAAAQPGVVLPAQQGHGARVAVVIDTSGSMNSGRLATAVAETRGVLQAVAGTEPVTVIDCDAETHSVVRARTVRALGLRGGGGTDMRVGIARALDMRPSPDVVVVVTDGETPWPEQPPATAAVIVVLVDTSPYQSPPTWATVVRVTP